MTIMCTLTRQPRLRLRIGYMKRGTYPALRADVPLHGGNPPKLSGCGKLQIFILCGKKFEKSYTHDFAQHISAYYRGPSQNSIV